MKNVMNKAWQIARKGQKQFGGKVKEYFAEALKLAWAIYKASKAVATVKTTSGSKNHKSWVAQIVGPHAKWKLDRQFVNAVSENDWDGKVFELKTGVYEVCNAGDREFIRVDGSDIEYIEYADVIAVFA
ncbi:hypothetical protein SporoP37_01850 [Sporosarcina sp. P37]|uniref:hypothetical protein n=1 Tax=unclassified Sporosarcina TaxID=2647733 RepID=UPI000A17F0C2|nr:MULTISPECIES: hypothetical protein [unclassified Sporosarcina]ARK23559.1 hypothetical protein SporoP37_01850 [Sporosarcina sp. P37]PID18818.1 hypothetical protein CSV62_06900 [Sporosarcina sp. P35]